MYYLNTHLDVFTEISFKRGVGYGNAQKFPLFDGCQGFATDHFKSREFDLKFKHLFKAGPNTKITARIGGYGEDNSAHKLNFLLDGQAIDDDLFAGYKVRIKEINRSTADLNESMRLGIEAVSNPEDQIVVATLEYTYPAEFVFDQNKYAKIKIGPGPIRKYLEIEDFDGGTEMFVYDITNNFYLKSIREANGIYKITIPESATERELILFNTSSIKSISGLQTMDFWISNLETIII